MKKGFEKILTCLLVLVMSLAIVPVNEVSASSINDDIADLEDAIENKTFTVAQATASTKNDLRTEIAKQINEMDEMDFSEYEANADYIIIGDFRPAVAETIAGGDGRNSSFEFHIEIEVSPGNCVHLISNGVIIHTPFEGETNLEAVARVKDLIRGTSFTLTQATANTTVDAKAEVVRQINAISGMETSGVTINTSGVFIGDFNSARAETSIGGNGEDGGFAFTVSIYKGDKSANTGIMLADIEHTKFNGETDLEKVEAGKTKVENATYTNPTNTEDYKDEEAVEAYIENIAKTAVNNNELTVTVNKTGYTAPVGGTKANQNGVNGEYKFTITISKSGHSETTTEKTVVVTAEAYRKMAVLSGDNQTIAKGNSSDVIFRVDGDFTKFENLYYNGKVVDKANYEAKSGSVIIKLKSNYVKTLGVGEHEFTVAMTNGYSVTNLNIKEKTENPETSDNILVYIILAISSAIVSVIIILKRKK